MASIELSKSSTNPTSSFLPVYSTGKFVDSVLYQRNNQLSVIQGGVNEGLDINNDVNVYRIGDIAGNTTKKTLLTIDSSAGLVKLSGEQLTATTAGLPAGQNLLITINDVQYKIALLQV